MPTSQAMGVMLSSASTEWYTPPPIIDMARAVMREIDLDPATAPAAQRWIRAERIFTIKDDGLSKEWVTRDGRPTRVWLNPPFGKDGGQSNAARWAKKLTEEYQAKRVTQACLLLHGKFGYEWFEALLDQYPACLLRHRLRFVAPNGDATGQAKCSQVLFYVGRDLTNFKAHFSRLGRIVLPK